MWAKWEEDEITLADVVEVGDYVNYPVEYTNVATFETLGTASLTGWRVLSKDIDIDGNEAPGTVNLVSAGVPLTYYHGSNTSTSITNLAINFLETGITTSNEGYRTSGFDAGKTLTEIFTNEYTDTYNTDTSVSYPGYNTTLTGTKTAGTPKVRAMTKEDLDKIYGATTTGGTSVTGNDLLAIPCSDKTGYYAYTWLASAYNSNYLWCVDFDGYMRITYNYTLGVRPVVSLKSEVATTGQDANGVWQLQ